jgi:hypothetical protein
MFEQFRELGASLFGTGKLTFYEASVILNGLSNLLLAGIYYECREQRRMLITSSGRRHPRGLN